MSEIRMRNKAEIRKNTYTLVDQAKHKILLVSPYATDPKKMALPPDFFFMIWNFFLFTIIYTFSLEDVFLLICYFPIQFYCKILN